MALGGYPAKPVLWKSGSCVCHAFLYLSNTAMWISWFFSWFCCFTPVCPLHIPLFILIENRIDHIHEGGLTVTSLWNQRPLTTLYISIACYEQLLLNFSYGKVTLFHWAVVSHLEWFFRPPAACELLVMHVTLNIKNRGLWMSLNLISCFLIIFISASSAITYLYLFSVSPGWCSSFKNTETLKEKVFTSS